MSSHVTHEDWKRELQSAREASPTLVPDPTELGNAWSAFAKLEAAGNSVRWGATPTWAGNDEGMWAAEAVDAIARATNKWPLTSQENAALWKLHECAKSSGTILSSVLWRIAKPSSPSDAPPDSDWSKGKRTLHATA